MSVTRSTSALIVLEKLKRLHTFFLHLAERFRFRAVHMATFNHKKLQLVRGNLCSSLMCPDVHCFLLLRKHFDTLFMRLSLWIHSHTMQGDCSQLASPTQCLLGHEHPDGSRQVNNELYAASINICTNFLHIVLSLQH